MGDSAIKPNVNIAQSAVDTAQARLDKRREACKGGSKGACAPKKIKELEHGVLAAQVALDEAKLAAAADVRETKPVCRFYELYDRWAGNCVDPDEIPTEGGLSVRELQIGFTEAEKKAPPSPPSDAKKPAAEKPKPKPWGSDLGAAHKYRKSVLTD